MSWLKWLAKVAGSAIVVSLITLVMTWYVVSLVVTNIFQQLQLPANMIPQVQFSDVLTGIFQNPQTDRTKPNDVKPTETKPPLEQSTVPKGSTEVMGSPVPGSDGAVEVWKQNEDQVVLDREALGELKDKISTEDKMIIFNIISSKVPEDDIQKISKLIENGVTNEGLKQIQEILLNRLEPQEYQELMGILTKNDPL
jgi:hypothetical protein